MATEHDSSPSSLTSSAQSADSLHDRWNPLRKMLSNPSPFGNETGKLPNGIFEPSIMLFDNIRHSKILVVGAGGLGCEILKDLALTGFTDIHVIDLDTIDISNLNRQFLFRKSDVGQPKATVAANFIMKRVQGCHVTAYHGKIQDHKEDFYKQFKIIISGLDNVEARRWLNSLLVGLVEVDDEGNIDPETIIPLIDGGTEGFKGQARVILPRVTSCFECSIDSFPPPKAFPLCTIAETPRIPEHCITYAFLIEWEKERPDQKLDKDSPEDMQWVFERALQRAQKFGIDGVTYFKTLGVVKNVIPAVASTNAIIAACCTNEAVKLLSFCGQTMNTYLMYMGNDGIYTNTFEYGRKDDCPVCSENNAKRLTVSSSLLLKDFISQLCNDPTLQLKKPSLTAENSSLYMTAPPSLESALRSNLEKPLGELISNGENITVTDNGILKGVNLNIVIEFN